MCKLIQFWTETLNIFCKLTRCDCRYNISARCSDLRCEGAKSHYIVISSQSSVDVPCSLSRYSTCQGRSLRWRLITWVSAVAFLQKLRKSGTRPILPRAGNPLYHFVYVAHALC